MTRSHLDSASELGPFGYRRVVRELAAQLPSVPEQAWLAEATRSCLVVLASCAEGAALFMRHAPANHEHLRFIRAEIPTGPEPAALLAVAEGAVEGISFAPIGVVPLIEVPCHFVLPIVVTLTDESTSAALCERFPGGRLFPFVELCDMEYLRSQPLPGGLVNWAWDHPRGIVSSMPAMVWRVVLEITSQGWDAGANPPPLGRDGVHCD